MLSQCSPGNPGLRPLYLPLLKHAKEEGKGEEDDFAAMLLNLFVTASLMLLKKTGSSRSTALGMPLRYLRVDDNGNDPKSGTRSKIKGRYLATAATHVLMRRKDTLVSWGSSSHGVLGNGPTGSRFGTPSVVSHFAALNIRCGFR